MVVEWVWTPRLGEQQEHVKVENGMSDAIMLTLPELQDPQQRIRLSSRFPVSI